MRYLLSMTIGMIAGAASAQISDSSGSQLQPSNPVASAAENLVIYRAHAEPTAWSPAVRVDGRKIVSLPNRHYTSTSVAPGAHRITVSWPFIAGQGETSMDIIVEGNEAHFFEITGTYRYAGGVPASGAIGGVMYFRKGIGIAEATPEHARQVIASCCKFKSAK